MYVWAKKETSLPQQCETLPRPGFEPGLLRPQRRVLTTRRSRLFQVTCNKYILFKTIYPQCNLAYKVYYRYLPNIISCYFFQLVANFSPEQQPMLHLLWFSCRPTLFLLLPNAKPHNQSTKFTGKLIDLCRSRKIAVLSIKKQVLEKSNYMVSK